MPSSYYFALARNLRTALAAVLLAAVLLVRFTALAAAVSAPARADASVSAVDGKPWLSENCISYKEFKTMQGGTMRQIETTVDATGTVVHTQYNGRVLIVQYKWCDHSIHDGFFQIGYYGPSGHRVGQTISMFDFTEKPGPLEHQPAGRALNPASQGTGPAMADTRHGGMPDSWGVTTPGQHVPHQPHHHGPRHYGLGNASH